jgi:small subunit ribosomal protein S20
LANIQSAIKRIRQSEKARQRNRVYRTRARTYVKRTNAFLEQNRLQEANESAMLAISALDRAVSRGVIHKNNAARRKSRLMARLLRARAAAATD